ncbi:MAG TPA: hypothetical protein VN132_15395, partial [Bdellovibrio sp.]|nr:hypothetical protein [Bdellovibrio sp.]
GRGEFLVRSIAQLEKEIMSFQRVQDQVQTEIARFNGEILSIPSGLKECSSQIIYNPATQKNEAELICSEPPYIQSLRSNLYSQMNEMRDQFTKNASILRNMMEHLSQYRSELTKIPLTQLASVSSTK